MTLKLHRCAHAAADAGINVDVMGLAAFAADGFHWELRHTLAGQRFSKILALYS